MDRLTKAKVKHKAGLNLLEQVVRPDVLEPRVQGIRTFEEGLAERRALTKEISTLGKYVDKYGFSPGRDFFKLATIKSSVWAAVMEVFGDEWDAADAQGKRDLFAALVAGPLRDYNLNKKPTLT